MLASGLTFFFALLTLLAIFVYTKVAPPFDWQSSLQFGSVKIPLVIYVPVLWMSISVFFLYLYAKNKIGVKQSWMVVLIVALEMSTFGWFHEWRMYKFPVKLVHENIINDYNNRARQSQQKLISNQGAWLQSDLGRLYGIYTLNWYGPLMLKRYSEATMIDTAGFLDPRGLSDRNVGLDIFGGRYLFLDPLSGINPQALILGNGCGANNANRQLINLPTAINADRVAIVSSLACSSAITDGQPVADLILHNEDRQEDLFVLRAGLDTAEHSADHPNVIPLMHHQKARIFESKRMVSPEGRSWDAHTYIAQYPFLPRKVNAIELTNIRNGVYLNVHSLTLLDSKTGGSQAIDPNQSFSVNRWHLVQAVDKFTVYENLRALPAVWLVFKAIPVSSAQALEALHTSVLPDGRSFDPAREALVEKGVFVDNLKLSSKDKEGKSRVDLHDDMKWEIHAQSNSPSLLVIGQNYYPGWRAEVDGKAVDILRVNYTQQGVLLPVGEHKIVLRFQPRSFTVGLAISSVSLIVLIFIIGRHRRRPLFGDKDS